MVPLYRRRMITRTLLGCILGAIAFLFVSAAPVGAAKKNAELLVFDQWMGEGQTVWLKARLLSKGGVFSRGRPISGERVQFQLNEQYTPPTLTGGDGFAATRIVPPSSGTYVVKAKLMDNPRYEAGEGEGLLLYGSAQRKIIIVSAQSLKRSAPPGGLPFLNLNAEEPMPAAAEVLTELSESYQLIYFYDGNRLQFNKMHQWFREKEFPDAPLMIGRFPATEENRKDQITSELSNLEAVGDLYLGITRSPTEAMAFHSIGMKAFILSEDDEIEASEESVIFSDWKEVLSLIPEG